MNKKIVVAIILVTVCLVAGFALYQTRHQSEELQFSGNVDIRQVNVAFRVGGRLKTLQVDEGAQVKAGDVLGELDDQPYRIALADAQANNAALEAHNMLYKKGYRKEDIQQAKANLNTRLAALLNASQLLQRQQKITGTGAGSQRSLDDAQSGYDQATAQVDAARQQYLALSHGYRPEEIAEVAANRQRAAAQLNNAELQLADTVLKAPSNGIILTRAVEPGSMLTAGSTALTLSLTEPVWVRAYVAEPDLGKVAPGTRVKVITDSRKEPYNGVIGFVSPTAEFTPKNVETSDLRTALVYRLRVIVENADTQLRQGMPVTIKLAAH
ncbi:secretion protein HlyD [Solimicrobium silvestre]|uniref:Multidrug resistance efflux pump n=1 Tax=Solimicrobium silvestre TaxID=2099400 RepID=A0A2S9GSK0_9BURK|nr:secretion protein HlyD [Solimicrobium silvestre]PRC90699.1 Multidrug resistance efflux pump [Solimicrobium silvestre]